MACGLTNEIRGRAAVTLEWRVRTVCKCRENNWCRLWQETQDGKYPYSEHAPGCDEYKQEEFTVIEYDGTRCVMEPHEAKVMIAEDEDVGYSVSTVMLTRDQFERMADFEGF
jgi:hypothetical protein